ncbi:apoptogenic protein 1, mitochondrial [Caerostris extrusa]|uniref:Apoptogenic protein 1, mitochondrial n=1 Tax=Caerostris extrusa TaxID=172846 RepID=A0AAV4UGS9_CAEEX|nr:apoptogenic protein 1, mitochondrial [Caerostris extrusa]
MCENKKPNAPSKEAEIKPFPENDDANLTKEEKDFYVQCKETQEWNHNYWEAHNEDFQKSRKLYIEKISKEKNLTTDEVAQSEDMANFYQHFLKINHSKHISYNWEWYRKNLHLLYLGAKVNFAKLKKFFIS